MKPPWRNMPTSTMSGHARGGRPEERQRHGSRPSAAVYGITLRGIRKDAKLMSMPPRASSVAAPSSSGMEVTMERCQGDVNDREGAPVVLQSFWRKRTC